MSNTNNKIVTHMTIYVDDSSHNVPAYIYAKQYDTRSRYINVRVMSANGQIFSWDTARLNTISPVGKALYVMGEREDDGTVTVEITQGLLMAVGKVSCDITLYKDEDMITTSTFYILVDKSNFVGDAPESTDSGTIIPYYTKDEIDNVILPYIQSDEDGTFYPIKFVDRDEYDELENPDEVYHNIAVFLLEPRQTEIEDGE